MTPVEAIELVKSLIQGSTTEEDSLPPKEENFDLNIEAAQSYDAEDSVSTDSSV